MLRAYSFLTLFLFVVPLALNADDSSFKNVFDDSLFFNSCDVSCDDPSSCDVFFDESEVISPITEVDDSYGSLPNLENSAQDFVLETKRLIIPGRPGAFNPSIARWHGSMVMSFRVRDPRTVLTDKIGFVHLDQAFNIISEPVLLEMRGNTSSMHAQAQDARLITVGEKLYIVYSNMDSAPSYVRRMYVAEVKKDGESFFIEKSKRFFSFDNERPDRWEKNWVPFDYEGNLFLARTLFPHQVMHGIPETGVCKTLASTWGDIRWDWGVLRGGTPALLNGNEYLAFFHSRKDITTVHSKGQCMTHYFMGAYTFSQYWPFSLTSISPEPIVGKGFYSGPTYKTWKPLRVVFPCGYVCDEKNVWIVYGKQDHEIWVVKLDKKGLLSSLVPVDLL